MIRSAVTAVCLLVASPVVGDVPNVGTIVETHVLPRYERLASETGRLAESASASCGTDASTVQAAYHDAFDAWVGVSHLRFGPSEEDDRAFALAFWPDPRGSTPKALAAMIRGEDAAVRSPEEFATVSIAARGFYALEFLLFDPQFTLTENQAYYCALVGAVTADIARNAANILEGWKSGYAELISDTGNDTYRTPTEAAQQLFTALSTGLEFTSLTRLGRPLSTFDRPKPNRAEARRSERSLRNVTLSLEATGELANLLSSGNEEVDIAFGRALDSAQTLSDPVFAGVSDPIGRVRVEALQLQVNGIRALLSQEVGPSLGVAAGFNSLDGD